MKFKYTFIAIILLVPTLASASDWITSSFSINATYLDLVSLTKTPAFNINGKAVFRKDLYSGHVVINSTPFKCQSVGYAVLSKGGTEQYICNMDKAVFMDMIAQQAEKKLAFFEAQNVLIQYFKKYSSVDYTTIPVGFPSAQIEEQISEYSLQYLEPYDKQLEVDLDYSASGITDF